MHYVSLTQYTGLECVNYSVDPPTSGVYFETFPHHHVYYQKRCRFYYRQ